MNGQNKILSLDDAVNLIKDNTFLALGGFTLYRRPTKFILQFLKKNTAKNLNVLTFTAGIETDLLVGFERVNTIRTCYAGLEIFGFAPMFKKFAEQKKIRIIEETEASICFGLRASLADVDFMPGKGWFNTDMLKLRPEVQVVKSPYSEKHYVAYPRIDPEICVLHAQNVDKDGNAQLIGNLAIDRELALASKTTIVTAENIVETDKLIPDKVSIPGCAVKYIVHVPNGAKPTSCYPFYNVNGEWLLRYIESCYYDKMKEYISSVW